MVDEVAKYLAASNYDAATHYSALELEVVRIKESIKRGMFTPAERSAVQCVLIYLEARMRKLEEEAQ